MTPLNLSLLSRILTQPWAIRRDTLVSYTQGLLMPESLFSPAGQNRQRADSTFNVLQWDDAAQSSARKPLPTKPGYVVANYEGLIADRRGTLPDLPAGMTCVLMWGALGRGWTEIDRWYLDPIDVDEIVTAISATAPGSTVVLWFRSPGGIVTGIPEAATALRKLGVDRRLVAYSDECCASAAYWLAAQCQRITSAPTAEIGSIGVYLAFYDFVDYLAQRGVKLELFKAGDLKGLGVMGNPLDDAAREYLQAGVVDAYRQFVTAVTEMRAMDAATMQGQTLRGKDAYKANLVDAFAPSFADYLATL